MLYVICESGFEYNDEIYHRPESGGGTPVIASADEEKINKACKEKNFKRFLNEFSDMRNYFYEPKEEFNAEAIELLVKHKVLKQEKGHRRDIYEWNDMARWQEVPADDLQKIYDGCKLVWFEVYEIEDTI